MTLNEDNLDKHSRRQISQQIWQHLLPFTQKGNKASRKLLEKYGFVIDFNRKDDKVEENLIYVKHA